MIITMIIFKFSDQQKAVTGKNTSLLFSLTTAKRNLLIHVKICTYSLLVRIIVISFELFLTGWSKILI
jgi:hypothetical protein